MKGIILERGWELKNEKEVKFKEEQYKNPVKNISVKNIENSSQENTSAKTEVKILEDEKEKIYKLIKESNSNFNEEFEILKFIGKGSSGVVFEGKPKKTNQKLALKFFIETKKNLDEKRKKEKNRQKFREVSFQRRLHHENIMPVYGHIKINEQNSCLVLGLGKYGDLNNFKNKLLAKKKLSETLICYLVKGILEALSHCHRAKIVHLDIKEDNIVIDEQLNPKLTDFSVSFSYENVKENEKLVLPFAGTSNYISPEVIRGDSINIKDISKTDTYSLGILAYRLAYSKFPFNLGKCVKNDFDEIEKTIKSENLNFPEKDNFSSLFKNFISRLLQKNIEDRLSVEEALNDPWIKLSEFLYEEKEKYCDLQKFLISLLTDGVRKFNECIN